MQEVDERDRDEWRNASAVSASIYGPWLKLLPALVQAQHRDGRIVYDSMRAWTLDPETLEKREELARPPKEAFNKSLRWALAPVPKEPLRSANDSARKKRKRRAVVASSESDSEMFHSQHVRRHSKREEHWNAQFGRGYPDSESDVPISDVD